MICSSMCLTSNSSGAGERIFSGMTSRWLTGSLSSARWLITITVPWNVFCPVFQEVDVIVFVFVCAPVAAQPGLVYQSTDFLQTGTHRSPSECTGYIMNVC